MKSNSNPPVSYLGHQKLAQTKQKLLEKKLIIQEAIETNEIKYYIDNEQKTLDLTVYLKKFRAILESGTNEDISFLPRQVEGFKQLVETLKINFENHKNSDSGTPCYNIQVQMLSKLFSSDKINVLFLKAVYDDSFVEWSQTKFSTLDPNNFILGWESDETCTDSAVRAIGESILASEE